MLNYTSVITAWTLSRLHEAYWFMFRLLQSAKQPSTTSPGTVRLSATSVTQEAVTA